MKFYYVYVLKSLREDFLYVGLTEDLKRRLKEHNNQEEPSTKHFAPFDIAHYEAYRNQRDTKKRENYLKTTKGGTTLRYMLQSHLSKHIINPRHSSGFGITSLRILLNVIHNIFYFFNIF